MGRKIKLPVGIEDFKEIRQEEFYYIDKTKLLEQLLEKWGKVNLFTRPRRFGKTLNMSMLRYFFEIGTDESLFDGLYIKNNKKICDEYMGKFPVIFISLKNVEGLDFETALYRFVEIIGREAERFYFLLDSEKLTVNEKERYKTLICLDNGRYSMDVNILASALRLLSELLYKHYGKKTIIIIDEYDVPLDKAFQNGYYREMVSLIRAMFGDALKTNDFLQFAILTGCLRVSKESIFIGLNNFKVLSIADTRFDEQFGFTDEEVQTLLESYGLLKHISETKEWYDGYHFGDADVYCPWDVINHVDRLCGEPDAKPQPYWINTSGNGLVKRFIDKANKTTRDEIERLVSGETIEKQVSLELTYDEIDTIIDNLWSVLFTTGYLTQTGMTESGAYKLVIPNKQVREVYKLQIQEWFKRTVMSNTEQLKNFWKAFDGGDTKAVENYLNRTLSNSISVFDTKARDEEKESSYHTILVGLLVGNADWLVKSNVEAGDGFADIIVETEDFDAGIIIELKYSKTFSGMDKACEKAITQIKEKRYDEYLKNDDRHDIMIYGIAFCKKKCKVIAHKI
ncbi:MAG: ATP-binding protein [Lachnospiraceae bacterium]|nr:MAG: ATP-binding protein [Lachnospiraceae bacterium]